MVGRIESTILRSLLYDEAYTRKVLPFLQDEYFGGQSESKHEQILFKVIKEYIQKYNVLPTPEAIIITLTDAKGLADDVFKSACDQLEECKQLKDQVPNPEWLIQETDKFCQQRAIDNAVMECVRIRTGDKKDVDVGAMPGILAKALAVCLDANIGHDYFKDADARFEFYHKKEAKIPFGLDYFDKTTHGGISTKTLNIILAGTNVGKTLIMCHLAAHYLQMGKNVLYITMEMAQELITKRIDANLLSIPLDDMDKLDKMPKLFFRQRIDALRKQTSGELVVREYPTGSASTAHFRHLVDELRMKKNFKPDIIFIDYINLCASSRVKHGPNVNSYTLIKAVAEELRGIGVEYDAAIWSATQTTRGGYNNSDVGLEDTSESFGLPATADFMFAAINSEELIALNQYMIKVLKNRHGDATQNNRFVIGVERAKMRLYDVEQSAQTLVGTDNKPEEEKKSQFESNKGRKKKNNIVKFSNIKV